MKLSSFAIILFLGTFSFAQTSTTVNEISFLNLKGKFTKSNGIFTDSSGTVHEVRFVRQCNVHGTTQIGREVISNGYIVAKHAQKDNIIILHYSDQARYVKLKKVDFLTFMEENTENGDLKKWSDLRINKKKIKVFCDRDWQSGKLSQSCN